MKDTNFKPSYYAVLTANVRYDNRLKPNEKLLYAEITALTSKSGECWASNSYFAELYDVSKDTISRWISDLKKYNYINIDFIYNGKEIDKRIIKLCNDLVPIKMYTGIDQDIQNIDRGIDQNIDRGIDQKVVDNSMNLNIMNSNNLVNCLLSEKSSSTKEDLINNYFEQNETDINQLKLKEALIKYSNFNFSKFNPDFDRFKKYLEFLRNLNNIDLAIELLNLSIDNDFASIEYINNHLTDFRNRKSKGFNIKDDPCSKNVTIGNISERQEKLDIEY